MESGMAVKTIAASLKDLKAKCKKIKISKKAMGTAIFNLLDGIPKILELTTIFNIITGRQIQIFIQDSFNIIHHRFQVPVPHIHTHHHPSMGIIPGNFRRSGCIFNIGQFPEWHLLPIGQAYMEIPDVFNIAAVFGLQPRHHIKTFLSLKYTPATSPPKAMVRYLFSSSMESP